MSDKDQRQRRDSRVRQPFPKSRGRAKAKALRFDTLSLSPQDFIHIPCSFLPSFLTNLQMPKGDSEEGSLTVCHGVWLCRFTAVSPSLPTPFPFPRTISLPCSMEAFHCACCAILPRVEGTIAVRHIPSSRVSLNWEHAPLLVHVTQPGIFDGGEPGTETWS